MDGEKVRFKAVVYRPGGGGGETVEAPGTVYRETGLEPDLAWLYETIGCRWVDVVRLPGADLWVDDEGLLVASPLNIDATLLCRHYGMGQAIAGVAVLVPRDGQ